MEHQYGANIHLCVDNQGENEEDVNDCQCDQGVVERRLHLRSENHQCHLNHRLAIIVIIIIIVTMPGIVVYILFEA